MRYFSRNLITLRVSAVRSSFYKPAASLPQRLHNCRGNFVYRFGQGGFSGKFHMLESVRRWEHIKRKYY